MTLRLGIVGFGKIARDQHVLAIAKTEGVDLVAIASRNASLDGVANYRDIDAMLAAEKLDAIALCQPPQVRFEAACKALNAGKHVFLEKPPGATVSEVEALIELAAKSGVTLYASWHSRYAAGVSVAKKWLAARAIRSVTITWKEDVRHWHPGQHWIWEPGGFGVFDPGINALSILTALVDEPLRVLQATLETPSNQHAPIAARLKIASQSGAPIDATFDFRQTGPQSWDIEVETDGGKLMLGGGGNHVSIDGVPLTTEPEGEYAALYGRFVDLVRTRRSDVDLRPIKLVADAFLCGRAIAAEPFEV